MQKNVTALDYLLQLLGTYTRQRDAVVVAEIDHRIAMHVARIGAIVKGERAITADTALRLARFYGTSPEFWINLQAMHDLIRTRIESGKAIARDARPRAA